MRTQRTLALLGMLGALSSSCAAGAECERTRLPDGRLEVTCPRLDPILLLDEPDDPDAPCTRDLDVITCGATRYDLGGARLPDLEADAGDVGDVADDVTGETDELGGPGEPGLAGGSPGAQGARRSSPCQVIGEAIACAGGATATLGELEAGEGVRCTYELLSGHGRRIVCRDGDLVEILTPDGASSSPPVCVQDPVGRVTCEDGSAYLEGDLGGPLSGAGEPCRAIRLEPAPAQVVAECTRALSCPAGDSECLTAASSSVSPECERALSPALVCVLEGGEEVEVEPPAPCHTPREGLRLTDEASAAALRARDCPMIFGDVVVAPASEGEPGPDLRVLSGLLGVHTIQGSLQLIGATLPQDDDSILEFFELTQELKLTHVLGEVRFERTQAPVVSLPALDVLTGNLVLEANRELVLLDLLDTLFFVAGDVYVSRNPRLDRASLSEDPLVPGIGGAFAWGANGLDPCALPDLLTWALTRSRAVFIGSSSADDDPLCAD